MHGPAITASGEDWGGVRLPSEKRQIRCGLDRTDDEGVDAVEGDRQQQPENGGEEEAANDLADVMVVEESVGGAQVRLFMGEASESCL